MPLNIITKLKTKNIFNSRCEKDYLVKAIIKLNPKQKHKLEINYVKKSNGNGPKVLDS